MKADFFKRIFAYLIDYFIITIVLMGITASVNIGSDLTKEINDVMNDYKEGNITVEEYTEKVMPLNYELTKRKLPVNVATSVVFIGYYIVFAYVNDKGERPSIWNMVIRGLLIYGIVTTLYSTISINFLDMEKFNYSVSVISAIESMIIIISILMMLYKKDGRGLHDIIAKTNVIREE